MNNANGEGPKEPLVAMVVGTRPEIIKVAPILKASISAGIRFEVIHTGQHYSYEMDSLIFHDLELPSPHHNLQIGSGSHAEETSKALVGLENLFRKMRPSVVLVLGDTNSTLAGALAAAKLHIPVGHVEAGLRSFDRRMPEETNRVLTDHISDVLFAPTEVSAKNLSGEGISAERTLITGNTIVDAMHMALQKIPSKSTITENSNQAPVSDSFLLTLHREENVDDEGKLRKIIQGVAMVSEFYRTGVVFPAHPRTVKRIQQCRISLPQSLALVPPIGYLDFLDLERGARLILTDSGGVQEEACILGVPCITLRDNTERPETIEVGANLLVGHNPKDILQGAALMLERPRRWAQPFGDGKASVKIMNALAEAAWCKQN